MKNLKNKILDYLQIDEKDLPSYLKEVGYEDLEDPHTFFNINKAVMRMKKAIENKEKIMVYGDYDCDGVSATSIMVKTFGFLNYKIGYYLPSRYLDGYGITLERAKQIESKGYKLVITVDNGVTANEAINYLSSKGIDVIITDHHCLPETLPNAYTIVHPFMKNSDVMLPECGGYVAFMISVVMLNRIDDYLLTLAAIATISDMMPLLSYNRTIVKLALKIINENKSYPYHLLLAKPEHINETTLNFDICPKINSIGRIKEDTSINHLIRFFTEDDNQIKQSVLKEINEANNKRKEEINHIVNTLDESKYESEKIIVDSFDNLKEGLIGLLAGRLTSSLKKPSFIFSHCLDEHVYKGSARSFESLPLVETFKSLSPYLITYGGHAKAGGLTIQEDKFADFVSSLKTYVKDKKIIVPKDKFIIAEKDELTYEIYQFLENLSPFGQDFEKVNFAFKVNKNEIRLIGNNKSHIKGKVNENCSFLGFNMASKIINDEFFVIGNLEYDDYFKGQNIVLKVNKIMSLEEAYGN